MRLSCPQCHTEYEVPDAALTGRPRTLRCADCGTKWKAPVLETVAEPEELAAETAADADLLTEPSYDSVPEPVATDEADMAEPEPEPAMSDSVAADILAAKLYKPTTSASAARKTSTPAKEKPNRGLGISILLVLLAIALILVDHRAIGHIWPPSLRLFNALGLH